MLTETSQKEERAMTYFAAKTLSSYGRTPSKEDIREVLSNAYLRAATLLNNDKQLKIKNYSAWLRRILFFVCLDYVKKETKLILFDDIEELQSVNGIYEIVNGYRNQDPESIFFNKEFADELMSSIDEKERKIIKMSVEGYKSEEIGKLLNENPSNVRQIKSRALKKLRQKIEVSK